LREWRGVFLVRIELEGLAARLAAEMVSEAVLAELQAVQAEMAALCAAGRLDRLSAENRRFHGLIAGATGYQTLEELVNHVLLTVARYQAVLEREPAVWQQVLTEHQEILDALASRDPVLAEAAAQAHVRRQFESTLVRWAGVLEPREWADAG
jgi:DNA-binding GntR family transcriptional regulator